MIRKDGSLDWEIRFRPEKRRSTGYNYTGVYL